MAMNKPVKDIFDTVSIDDLPHDFQRAVSKKRNDTLSTLRNRVHNLIIDAQRPVSVSQIMVAYYRMGFGTIKRIDVYNSTTVLVADGAIDRCGRGLYQVHP